mgnify:CR=1 FL=1
MCIRDRVWNDKKISAHHAIIPTQARCSLSKLDHRENRIYDMIRRRYLAQFYPDYEYDQSSILITVGDDKFKTSGRIMRIMGWKALIQVPLAASKNAKTLKPQEHQPRSSAANTDQDKPLPAVEPGDSFPCDHLKLLDKLTKPPRHYTEGTLIRAMESIGLQVKDKVLRKILRETAGLGTQATRANIIQTLFQRQFIQKEKKCIKATPLGCQLVDMLPDSIKDPILTAQWEQQLEDIATGKSNDIDSFLQQQISLVNAILRQAGPSNLSQAIKANNKPVTDFKNCPACGQPLEIRKAVKGPRIGQEYIGCSHFPECRFYRWPE